MSIEKKKEQNRFNVTFRRTESEEKLYEWVKKKSQIGGASAFIKNVLFKEMEREEKE
ncbi:hypothetical protein ACRTAO_002903 [Clostridium perfringens]